ncbi:hypothetical protein ABZ496_14470 [Nocardia rhamnosiphila]|uniref:Uncharacterized protein n=1 Tax=Nocardia rhamnosiphila TaxID=426716 RepID=A0ABV2WIN2_9NOCA
MMIVLLSRVPGPVARGGIRPLTAIPAAGGANQRIERQFTRPGRPAPFGDPSVMCCGLGRRWT